MNKILAAVFAFSFPFLATGCTTTFISDRIASGVNAYCDNTNQAAQGAIRERIESRTDHTIRVECNAR